MLHLDEKNFKKEILESDLPALVDFSATWCGPCKMVAPIIEELANEYEGKFKIAKLDIEEAQNIAMNYSIMSVPTFLFFKKGKVISQFVGALTKQQFKAKIESFID